MSIYFNQQITTFGSGFGPSFGCGCLPMPAASYSVFGPAPYPVTPMPVAPVPVLPMMGCYPMSDGMAAGYCAGAILAMPGAVQAIGNGLKWGYNNIIKPVWNGVVKPAWNFVKNDILKPIGSGLKWLWDHSLGWCLKKLEGATSKNKSEDDEDVEVEETSQASEASESEEE